MKKDSLWLKREFETVKFRNKTFGVVKRGGCTSSDTCTYSYCFSNPDNSQYLIL